MGAQNKQRGEAKERFEKLICNKVVDGKTKGQVEFLKLIRPNEVALRSMRG